MADQKELSVGEVRRTISTSLAAAFGFVIALIWNNVVSSGLATAGVSLTSSGGWGGWAILVVTALVITIVMIILIIVIGRWGSKA